MPRLIVLLLALVSLALLAIQNLATSVSLVVLSNTLPSIPLGILLVSAVGVGALITLVLYGLVGARRPPESKYRPMGRRVPYPEGPGTTLPSTDSTPYSSGASSSYGGAGSSSSAFVTEPAPGAEPSVTPSNPEPFTPEPKDTPPTDSYRSPSAEPGARYDSFAKSPVGSFVQQPVAGIKSVFGKKKDRGNRSEETLRPVGDDWGQRRTTEHKNTWELDDSSSKAEEGIKGLVNFGRSVGTNAGRLAEDIATGWGNQQNQGNAANSNPEIEGYGSEHYYADDSYYSGNRSDGYDSALPDNLDRGWENLDDYKQGPRPKIAPGEPIPQKRTYGDSLYSERPYADDETYEGPYEEGAYEEGPYEEEPYEEGPEEGVYEADYRVIVPPSKPLDSD